MDRQILEDVFVTSLEGGSNYWYVIKSEAVKMVRKAVPKEKTECLSQAIFEAVLDHGVMVDVHDLEEPDDLLGTLSKSAIESRLKDLAQSEAYRWALREVLSENGDASSSDVVFQYLVMGDVVFG